MARRKTRRGLGVAVSTADALKRHVREVCRSPYFDPATTRFWSSRLGRVYPSKAQGATYFVTSEKTRTGPRRYSVRRLKGCHIETISEFMQYKMPAQAQSVAKRLSRGTNSHLRDRY